MTGFSRFVGIDWSGAKGARQKGLAVASVCKDRLTLEEPPSGRKSWSRAEVTQFIGQLAHAPGRTLVGIDSAFSLPFMDTGSYLPGVALPTSAVALWSAVEAACARDDHYYGGGFVRANAGHYHQTGQKGACYHRRMRVTEELCIARGAGSCESVFHLIGPSQVGLSGLSTIRMLAHLTGYAGIAVWPFQDTSQASVVLVEIYAALFAAMGGSRGKVRDTVTLTAIVAALGPGLRMRVPGKGTGSISDDAADALLTAAGLCSVAHDDRYWKPAGLSTMVRESEGWIFGLR